MLPAVIGRDILHTSAVCHCVVVLCTSAWQRGCIQSGSSRVERDGEGLQRWRFNEKVSRVLIPTWDAVNCCQINQQEQQSERSFSLELECFQWCCFIYIFCVYHTDRIGPSLCNTLKYLNIGQSEVQFYTCIPASKRINPTEFPDFLSTTIIGLKCNSEWSCIFTELFYFLVLKAFYSHGDTSMHSLASTRTRNKYGFSVYF